MCEYMGFLYFTLRAIARGYLKHATTKLHGLCNSFLFIKRHHFLLKYTFYPTTARPFGWLPWPSLAKSQGMHVVPLELLYFTSAVPGTVYTAVSRLELNLDS